MAQNEIVAAAVHAVDEVASEHGLSEREREM